MTHPWEITFGGLDAWESPDDDRILAWFVNEWGPEPAKWNADHVIAYHPRFVVRREDHAFRGRLMCEYSDLVAALYQLGDDTRNRFPPFYITNMPIRTPWLDEPQQGFEESEAVRELARQVAMMRGEVQNLRAQQAPGAAGAAAPMHPPPPPPATTRTPSPIAGSSEPRATSDTSIDWSQWFRQPSQLYLSTWQSMLAAAEKEGRGDKDVPSCPPGATRAQLKAPANGLERLVKGSVSKWKGPFYGPFEDQLWWKQDKIWHHGMLYSHRKGDGRCIRCRLRGFKRCYFHCIKSPDDSEDPFVSYHTCTFCLSQKHGCFYPNTQPEGPRDLRDFLSEFVHIEGMDIDEDSSLSGDSDEEGSGSSSSDDSDDGDAPEVTEDNATADMTDGMKIIKLGKNGEVEQGGTGEGTHDEPQTPAPRSPVTPTPLPAEEDVPMEDAPVNSAPSPPPNMDIAMSAPATHGTIRRPRKRRSSRSPASLRTSKRGTSTTSGVSNTTRVWLEAVAPPSSSASPSHLSITTPLPSFPYSVASQAAPRPVRAEEVLAFLDRARALEAAQERWAELNVLSLRATGRVRWLNEQLNSATAEVERLQLELIAQETERKRKLDELLRDYGDDPTFGRVVGSRVEHNRRSFVAVLQLVIMLAGLDPDSIDLKVFDQVTDSELMCDPGYDDDEVTIALVAAQGLTTEVDLSALTAPCPPRQDKGQDKGKGKEPAQ